MNKTFVPLLVIAAAALAACSSMNNGTSASTSGMNPGMNASASDGDTAVILLPTQGAAAAMQAGCWATFYGERNFGGDSLTLVGPVDLQTLDKGTAQQLKRDIRSVETGPRATLLLYEKQFLSARSVGFQPASREGQLVEKLGFGGRIESIRLQCK